MLLPFLQQHDRAWYNIPPHEMKTTKPRTLLSYMNTHINRWKTKYDAVQKVIDGLPESRDHTAEGQAGDKRSLTLSDNLSQHDEEIKHGETPWGKQEPMIMPDSILLTEEKVGKHRKAGLTKSPPKPEPK